MVADAKYLETKQREPNPVGAGEFRGSFSGRERDVLFLNRDSETGFDEVGYAFQVDFADDGRAVAPVDIDGDGKLDLVSQSLQQIRVMRNPGVTSTRSFVRFALRATKSQHHALGAEVIVRTGKTVQRDYVKLTSGFQTQLPLHLHFGLGKAEVIDEVTVNWPSGTIQRHVNVPVNQLIRLVEDEEVAKASNLRTWGIDFTPASQQSFDLNTSIDTLKGKKTKIGVGRKPQIINFWAPWCKPCAEELPILAELAKENPTIRISGVSVEVENKASVEKAIQQYKLPYEQYFANDEVIRTFFGNDGEVPLPATFVFGEDGTLVRAFFRKITQHELQGLLRAIDSNQSDANLIRRVGERAVMEGDLGKGTEYFESALEESPNSVLVLLQMGGTLSGQGRHKKAIELLSKATKEDPFFPYAWHALGKAYSRAKQEELAKEAHEKAVELKPTEATYLLSLAATLVRLKKLEDALALFEKATTAEPQNFLGWLNLAKVRRMLNKPGAFEAIEKVLEIAPEHREAKTIKQRFQSMGVK